MAVPFALVDVYDKHAEINRKYVTIKDQNTISEMRKVLNFNELYETDVMILLDKLITSFYKLEKNANLTEFNKFFRVYYTPVMIKIESMIRDEVIDYSSLWYIYQEGKDINFEKYGQYITGRILDVEYVRGHGTNYMNVCYASHIINGREMEMAALITQIYEFDGTTSIGKLQIKLLSKAVKKKAETRISLMQALTGNFKHKYYESYAQGVNRHDNVIKKFVKSRIVIDETSMCKFSSQTLYTYIPSAGGRAKKKLGDMNGTLVKDLLYLHVPFAGGFSLSDKAWYCFDIEKICDIRYSDDAFEYIVLPNDEDGTQKNMMKSLVINQKTSFNDIIQGKGHGLVILLHGTPGVGKTLTAEATAEILHRPLYVVSSGELGIDAEDLEVRLMNALDLANEWQAIVLLDEADIFMEKRNPEHLERNALVSIFLQKLEYFNGVLFLTTNRVKEFDEAILSRISLCLRYPVLDSENRKQIWVNLLKLAKIKNIDVKQLVPFNINGRQIKNVIKLALCIHENNISKIGTIQMVNIIKMNSLLYNPQELTKSDKDDAKSDSRAINDKGGEPAKAAVKSDNKDVKSGSKAINDKGGDPVKAVKMSPLEAIVKSDKDDDDSEPKNEIEETDKESVPAKKQKKKSKHPQLKLK